MSHTLKFQPSLNIKNYISESEMVIQWIQDFEKKIIHIDVKFYNSVLWLLHFFRKMHKMDWQREGVGFKI
jgi:hypothetical protein